MCVRACVRIFMVVRGRFWVCKCMCVSGGGGGGDRENMYTFINVVQKELPAG